MFESLKILRAARRLGLEDRGTVEDHQIYGITPTVVHDGCCTRLRVGIDKASNSFIYCWRCRQITLCNSGRVETPEQRRYREVVEASQSKIPQIAKPIEGNIIAMARYKKTPPANAT